MPPLYILFRRHNASPLKVKKLVHRDAVIFCFQNTKGSRHPESFHMQDVWAAKNRTGLLIHT